jgi:hypothetical protein
MSDEKLDKRKSTLTSDGILALGRVGVKTLT